jgi:hypothetical protein
LIYHQDEKFFNTTTVKNQNPFYKKETTTRWFLGIISLTICLIFVFILVQNDLLRDSLSQDGVLQDCTNSMSWQSYVEDMKQLASLIYTEVLSCLQFYHVTEDKKIMAFFLNFCWIVMIYNIQKIFLHLILSGQIIYKKHRQCLLVFLSFLLNAWRLLGLLGLCGLILITQSHQYYKEFIELHLFRAGILIFEELSNGMVLIGSFLCLFIYYGLDYIRFCIDIISNVLQFVLKQGIGSTLLPKNTLKYWHYREALWGCKQDKKHTEGTIMHHASPLMIYLFLFFVIKYILIILSMVSGASTSQFYLEIFIYALAFLIALLSPIKSFFSPMKAFALVFVLFTLSFTMIFLTFYGINNSFFNFIVRSVNTLGFCFLEHPCRLLFYNIIFLINRSILIKKILSWKSKIRALFLFIIEYIFSISFIVGLLLPTLEQQNLYQEYCPMITQHHYFFITKGIILCGVFIWLVLKMTLENLFYSMNQQALALENITNKHQAVHKKKTLNNAKKELSQ